MCNKIKSSVIIGCQLSDIIAADTGNGTFKSICQSHSFIQPLFTHMSCIFSLNTTELLHIFYTKSELILGVSGLHIYLLVNTAVNSGNRIFSQDVSQQNLWSNELISGWTITSMFLCSKWRQWNNVTLFVSSQIWPFQRVRVIVWGPCSQGGTGSSALPFTSPPALFVFAGRVLPGHVRV